MKDLAHLEINEYLQILWNRRWYFLVIAVLVSAGFVGYALWVPDVFKSETGIMVEEPIMSGDYNRSAPRISPEERIGIIREQLLSRTFLERMIEQLPMYGYGRNPKFVMEKAVNFARSQIGIEKTSNNTFAISFLSPDPQFSQTVTRQLAQELIRISSSSRKDKVVATDQFIDEQLRQCTENLAAQGEKIKQFKSVHLGELPEQETANMNSLTGLHSQLNSVENAIQQAQERQKNLEFRKLDHQRTNLLSQSLAAVDSPIRPVGNTSASSAEIELAAKKSLLAQYSAKYTQIHPDISILKKDIDRLEQQIQKQKSVAAPDQTSGSGVVADPKKNEKTVDQSDPMEAEFLFEASNIKSEIAKREKEKQEIVQQIKIYQSRLKLAPSLEQELSTLLRDENVLKTRFDSLQKQKISTQMATSAESDNKNGTYRIIDEANYPMLPQSPNRLRLLLIGMVAGLMLGLGAAFGRELIDTTIGSEEEAKKLLNLPILVTIPTVPKDKKGKKQKVA
jgi:polysaccharide biosynthesis transport protein